MKRFWYVSACAVVFSVLAAGKLQAQPPTPGVGLNRPPAFSPWLNLTRPGGSATVNYFDLVQPQFQTYSALLGLAGDVAANRQSIGDLAGGNLPTTGHATQFLNYGSYFLNNGVGQGSVMGGGATRP